MDNINVAIINTYKLVILHDKSVSEEGRSEVLILNDGLEISSHDNLALFLRPVLRVNIMMSSHSVVLLANFMTSSKHR